MPQGDVTNLDFERAIADTVHMVNGELDRLLPPSKSIEAILSEAMRYASLQGGKRMRAFLVMETANLFQVNKICSLRVAAAIEMVHAYSLVHDDLPAMDDSPMRRGRPSLHIQFGEATAILAGDALLTAAFEILAGDETHNDARIRIELVRLLAESSGVRGMCGGQMADLLLESQSNERDKVNGNDNGIDNDNAKGNGKISIGNSPSPSSPDIIGMITHVQRLKTGALIGFSCMAGAILGKASTLARLSLQNYAHDVGLAFQIKDDLLDYEGIESLVGKNLRQDAAKHKANFVTVMGAQRAAEQAALLVEQACHYLEPFGARAARLRHLAHFAINRQN